MAHFKKFITNKINKGKGGVLNVKAQMRIKYMNRCTNADTNITIYKRRFSCANDRKTSISSEVEESKIVVTATNEVGS